DTFGLGRGMIENEITDVVEGRTAIDVVGCKTIRQAVARRQNGNLGTTHALGGEVDIAINNRGNRIGGAAGASLRAGIGANRNKRNFVRGPPLDDALLDLAALRLHDTHAIDGIAHRNIAYDSIAHLVEYEIGSRIDASLGKADRGKRLAVLDPAALGDADLRRNARGLVRVQNGRAGVDPAHVNRSVRNGQDFIERRAVAETGPTLAADCSAG